MDFKNFPPPDDPSLEDEDLTPEDLDALESLDALVEIFRDLPDAEFTKIANLPRLKQLKFCELAIRHVLKKAGCLESCEVTSGYNEFSSSLGFVTVDAPHIDITKMEWFARAAEFATNTEVYPLAENKVRLTFTFHGMTRPV